MTKSNLGRSLLHHARKQRQRKNAAYWFSQSVFLREPRYTCPEVAHTVGLVHPHWLLINKMSRRPASRPSWGRLFLSWGFLFPNGPGMCQSANDNNNKGSTLQILRNNRGKCSISRLHPQPLRALGESLVFLQAKTHSVICAGLELTLLASNSWHFLCLNSQLQKLQTSPTIPSFWG